jgi:hypothetical protein
LGGLALQFELHQLSVATGLIAWQVLSTASTSRKLAAQATADFIMGLQVGSGVLRQNNWIS